jgi:hypothetical protein
MQDKSFIATHAGQTKPTKQKAAPGLDCSLLLLAIKLLNCRLKMTSAKGNYQFSKLEPGIWIITFEKFGYDTLTIEVEIITYKGLRLDVAIRKTE